MPIGVLMTVPESLPDAVVLSGFNFDLFAALGSPTGPILYTLIVPSGEVAGGSGTSTVAIDASTGLHADSVGYWTVLGRVQAAGGDGGEANFAASTAGAGGGGGGAGTAVGIGGYGDPDGTSGANGTDTAGGTGGLTSITGQSTSLDNATAGGDAIKVNHQIYIENGSGEIWGGGGGGAAGYFIGLAAESGGDGGAPGAVGVSNSLPGAPNTGGVGGYAIRLIGGAPAPVFISGGSSPNVEGTIGA